MSRVSATSITSLRIIPLEWSGGTSELQLRDCGMLLRMNAAVIDDDYLDEWSAVIGVASVLESTRKLSRDAS